MIFHFDSKIRYSELGEDGCLTLNSIINYFQDCSTFHSEAIGLGLSNLERQQFVWMLSSWQIVVERYPKMGEEVRVSTWPYDFKGFYGSRNFTMETIDGEKLAYANSIWVFVDLRTGHPAKVTEQEIRGYELEEKLDMEYAPRKIRLPGEMEALAPFPVRKYHLDTNHHMNNGQYIQVAREFLPDDFNVRQMRSEYKKAAVFPDVFYPQVHIGESSAVIVLADEQGKPFAIVEFERR